MSLLVPLAEGVAALFILSGEWLNRVSSIGPVPLCHAEQQISEKF